MTRLRLAVVTLLFAAALAIGVSVEPKPAEAWNYYQVTCWTTTGSPYASGSAVSFSAKQAFIECVKVLISKRWGISLCGNAYYSYYSGGHYYGSATLNPNQSYCNYNRGNGFSAKGYWSASWN